MQKFEIRGINMDLDDNIQKYVQRKIASLDKYIPHQSRSVTKTEVQLKDNKSVDKNRCSCEVTMHLPHQTIIIKETTLNMYAAIDIVQMKLKQQLRKYKELHAGGSVHRRIFSRFGRAST